MKIVSSGSEGLRDGPGRERMPSPSTSFFDCRAKYSEATNFCCTFFSGQLFGKPLVLELAHFSLFLETSLSVVVSSQFHHQ